ncbi:hypothetical protein [Halovivax cerinus]|uniref:GtrA-like protein n=1 Tax=Halovivax cerinus TaxID=1487865 RepID=A0ABD5NK62_9EURY|nr:hypothetical protein [Halovivax cerinus]
MNLDPDRLPRWGWMTAGLVVMALVSNVLNVLVFYPLGLPVAYSAVTVIASMAPVIVYVDVWHDEDKRSYWSHDRLRVASDVVFVVLGTLVGASIVLLSLAETGLPRLPTELLAMLAGLLAGWALFYVRNSDLYFQTGDDGRGR